MQRVWFSLPVAAFVALLGVTPAGEPRAPQAPARDTAPQRAGTSRVLGRVLTADTSAPVRRALVRLVPADSRDSRSTVTDVDGKYEFRDVPSGSYRVGASKDAYLAAAFGANRRYPAGTTFKVGHDETIRNINVLLPRACAIAGHVFDEFGEGIARVVVTAYRVQSVGGVRQMLPGPEASTDDLGQYRIFGLQPGSYYLAALVTRDPSLGVEGGNPYCLTYYPGTSQPVQAQATRVVPGQDAAGIDFMLSVGRAARISGVALDSQGRPAASGSVSATLQIGTFNTYTPARASVRPDGSFAFPPLPSGDYTLTLAAPAQDRQEPDQREVGRARVTLAGTDVSGVTIQMGVGASLSGRVVFEGTSRLQSWKGIVIGSVPVDPADTLSDGDMPAGVREDGSFSLAGLFGQRLIRVSGWPAGWTVRAVYLNGRDVSETPVTFDGREAVTGAQVVLTDRVTRLTVNVTDDLDHPPDFFYLLVVADDPAKWAPALGSRYVRNEISRDGAPVKIEGLPPGDYFAVAFDADQILADLLEPDVLEQLRTIGRHFSLKETETTTLTLRVTGQ